MTPPGFSASPAFSGTAWESVGNWFGQITEHPFIRQLADGSLPEPVFIRYLVDDAHYLTGYASALASLAARATDPQDGAMLAGAAAGAAAAERGLHRGFLIPRGIDPDATAAAEPTPTCTAYIEGLRSAAALAPQGVGMAAVLPCFRVYAEVGDWISNRPGTSRTDHPYRAWIDTYADPAFAASVRSAEEYADRLSAAAGEQERQAMLATYQRSTRFEWMFWDAAWRGEQWPMP